MPTTCQVLVKREQNMQPPCLHDTWILRGDRQKNTCEMSVGDKKTGESEAELWAAESQCVSVSEMEQSPCLHGLIRERLSISCHWIRACKKWGSPPGGSWACAGWHHGFGCAPQLPKERWENLRLTCSSPSALSRGERVQTKVCCQISAFPFFSIWPCHVLCGILVLPPGVEPGPRAVKALSPNHWTAREFPQSSAFNHPQFQTETSYRAGRYEAQGPLSLRSSRNIWCLPIPPSRFQ